MSSDGLNISFNASAGVSRPLKSTTLLTLRNASNILKEFYKSVKSNTSFAKSPVSTVRTQGNHCFAAIYAFVKLEKLRIKTGLNHFAIKGKIHIEALKIAYDNLEKMGRTQNRLALV